MITTRWSNRIKVALGVFWGITLLTPLAVIPGGIGSSRLEGYHIEQILLAILWAYNPLGRSEPDGFSTSPLHFFNTIPILIFSLLFAGQVTRCSMRDASRTLAVALGVASLVFPAYLVLWVAWGAIMQGAPQYVGPLPHQFIFGILLIWYTKPEEDLRIWVE